MAVRIVPPDSKDKNHPSVQVRATLLYKVGVKWPDCNATSQFCWWRKRILSRRRIGQTAILRDRHDIADATQGLLA